MFYKLTHIYFIVSRIVNRCVDVLIYIWRVLISVLRAIRNTLDAIGHAIVWSLGMFILMVKYFFGLVAVVGVVGGLIAIFLGFREISFNLAMAGGFGCLLFLIVACVAPSIGRVHYYYDN